MFLRAPVQTLLSVGAKVIRRYPSRYAPGLAGFFLFASIPGMAAGPAAFGHDTPRPDISADSLTYAEFVRANGFDLTDPRTEPSGRLHPGGPRNIEAFALGYRLDTTPEPDERPRLEQGSDGKVRLVYPVSMKASAEVRIRPVYTTDLIHWRSDGVKEEEAAERSGRRWRRATLPEIGASHMAVALQIDYSFSRTASGADPAGEELVGMSETSFSPSIRTDPVGYVRMRVYGGRDGDRSYSALSVPFLQMKKLAGSVLEIEGNRVGLSLEHVDPADFEPSPSGRPSHFLEIRDGIQTGRLLDIAGTDGHSAVFLSENAEELGLSAGDAVVVREHWTLHSFFFPSSPANLTAGATPSEADNVRIFDPLTQQFETFWYWTDGDTSGWRDSESEPADDVVVHQARGLVVGRANPEDVTFLVMGEVRMTPLHAEVLPGYNILPNPFPMGYTLAMTGLREAGLQGAEFQVDADSIQAPRIGGGFELYWWTTREGSEGYVDFNYTPSDELLFLDAGQGFVLKRRGEEGFWWRAPLPASVIP